MLSWRFAGALGLLVAVSCGGAKSEPVVPAPPAGTGQPGPLVQVPLTPVAAPPEVFAVVRFQNPAKATDTGISWSGLPVDWRKLLSKEVPGLDAAIQYDAPIDFVAMLDPASHEEPNVFWAFSVGARSVESLVDFLRAQGGAASPDSGGGYRVKVDPKVTCAVSRALGTAPARAVCSEDPASVDALSAYMTRGLPLESFGAADLHAHVVAEPFRRRYGSQLALLRTVGVPFGLRELQVDHPKLDRALRDVLYGLADELIALAYDLGRIDVNGAFAANDVVNLDLSLGLLGKRSWTAQGIDDAAGHPGVATDAFWKLPADVTSANYSTYSNPNRAKVVAAALRELLDGFLDFQGLGDKRRVPLVDAFEHAMTAGGNAAYATLADSAPSSPVSKEAQAIRDAVGAHVLVLDQSGADVMKLCSELVKSASDPAFRARLAKSKAFSDVPLPKVRERGPKAPKGLAPGTRVYDFELAVPPKGALAEAGTKPAKKPKPELVDIVVVAVPAGPLTWFAFGADEASLERKLSEALAGSAPTLGTRIGLEALRTDPVLSGGFSTLASGVGRFLPVLMAAEGIPSDAMTGLSRLPHRGATPMLYRATASTEGPRVSMTLQVPRSVVEDVVAFGAWEAAAVKKH